MQMPRGIDRRFLGAAVAIIAASTLSFPVFSATRSKHMSAVVQESSGSTAVRPFRVTVSDAELADLRRRVKATQFPEKEPVDDNSQGVPLATMRKLASYWATEYDWRKVEAKLNSYPQFITEIDGLDIHFLHVRSKHP